MCVVRKVKHRIGSCVCKFKRHSNNNNFYKVAYKLRKLFTLMILCLGMSMASAPEVFKEGRDEEVMEGWLYMKLKTEMI